MGLDAGRAGQTFPLDKKNFPRGRPPGWIPPSSPQDGCLYLIEGVEGVGSPRNAFSPP